MITELNLTWYSCEECCGVQHMSYCADKYTSQFGGMTNQYAYYHEDDESTFQLVDTAKPQKPVYQRGRRMFNQV